MNAILRKASLMQIRFFVVTFQLILGFEFPRAEKTTHGADIRELEILFDGYCSARIYRFGNWHCRRHCDGSHGLYPRCCLDVIVTTSKNDYNPASNGDSAKKYISPEQE